MRTAFRPNNYRTVESVFDSNARRAWLACGVVAFLFVPLGLGTYATFLACIVGINIVATTGLNVLTGNTGLLSVGHAAFVGVGAYAAGWASSKLGVSGLLAIPFGGFVAAFVGILVGIPSLRIKGLYLAIATLAAQFIALFVFREWYSVTGGDTGLPLEPFSIFGLELDNDAKVYPLIFVTTILAIGGAAAISKTRLGRAFIAVRERDYSAEVLGVKLVQTKLAAFAISAFYAGVAGALMAYFYRVVSPGQFGFDQSVFFLSAIIVGGMGRVFGSILGAIFMTLTPELLNWLVPFVLGLDSASAAAISPSVNQIAFGALIIFFLLFEPLGLAEIWRRTWQAIKNWPYKT